MLLSIRAVKMSFSVVVLFYSEQITFKVKKKNLIQFIPAPSIFGVLNRLIHAGFNLLHMRGLLEGGFSRVTTP